jgi:secreted Zn-dependent insulinase-like peptidase
VQALESFETLMISNSYENEELEKAMQAYTYDEFKQQLKTMFRNAHFVWLITGNITP